MDGPRALAVPSSKMGDAEASKGAVVARRHPTALRGPANEREAEVIRLTMFPAQDGDSLLLEYGTDALEKRILIDGGRADTYADIRQPLANQVGRAGLDLLVVTHIDQDHILGILKLLEDPGRVPIRDVWFNGFGHLSDSAFESFGPKDGELLTSALLSKQLNWNRAFRTHPVEIDQEFDPLDDDARITILSPVRAQLGAVVPQNVVRVRDMSRGDREGDSAARDRTLACVVDGSTSAN
jgi:hypothetical protein